MPRQSIPIPDGPMFTAGDAALIPTGYSRLKSNLLRRPLRWDKRPPWVYDSQASIVGGDGAGHLAPISGLALWDDTTNSVTRLLAAVVNNTNYSGAYMSKATSGESWASAATRSITLGGPLLGDNASYRGTLYFNGGITGTAAAGGPSDGGVPTPIYSFNGTAIAPGTVGTPPGAPFPAGLTTKSLCVYKERVFFGWLQGRIVNKIASSISLTAPYDLTAWTATAVDVRNVGTGAGTVCRIVPTSTTSAKVELANVVALSGSQTDQAVDYMSILRGADKTTRMPMTAEIYVTTKWAAATAYAVGTIRISLAGGAAAGFRFRVVTATGNSGGGEPVWNTTTGATTADNLVTWICDGSDAFASTNIDVPNLTEVGKPTPYITEAIVPPFPAADTLSLGVRLKFGNASTSTGWTLAPVDVAYRDGLADSDSTKANWGQQVTSDGSPVAYHYPFYNAESSSAATRDLTDVAYTEPASNVIRATSTVNLSEMQGHPTAIRAIGNRLVVFKRKGTWLFSGTGDPDVVLSFDRFVGSAGCLHYRAVDEFESMLYFIGEDEVYSLSESGNLTPLCGEAMRETVMNKASASWVESQTQPYVVPHLKVDKHNRDLYVYTQKGIIYVYHLGGDGVAPGWSQIDVQKSGGAAEIADLIYYPTTQNMYCVVGSTNLNQEIRRLDASQTGSDSDAAAATYSIRADSVLKPIETSGPRYDATLELVGLYHASTASQASQSTTPYVSFDQGNTWTTLTAAHLTAASGTHRDQLPYYYTGPSVAIRFTHDGSGGASNFSYSHLDGILNVRRGEDPLVNPT